MERSALQKAYEQYHDQGFVILSVDIGEERENVQAFAQEKGLTFPILLDTKGSVASRYLVPGVPTSFFINREGIVQARYTGPLYESLIKEYLDQIL